MHTEFWHDCWRTNRIGFHQAEVNPLLRKYWQSLELPADAPVFVPLCGKSRDLLWLLEQGHRVTGAEISALAVEAFFAEAQLTPKIDHHLGIQRWRCGDLAIFCGDLFDLTTAHTGEVHGFYDRAALVALPTDLRQRYAKHIGQLLSSAAAGLLITMEYPPDEMAGPPFPVGEDEVRALFADQWLIHLSDRRDGLPSNERLRERGLSALSEAVYRLARNAANN